MGQISSVYKMPSSEKNISSIKQKKPKELKSKTMPDSSPPSALSSSSSSLSSASSSYSCSHWWHAPFYFAMSAALALTAITTMSPTTSKNSSPFPHSIKHDLALNASRALRVHGFNVVATLLQISPELFLSTPESTIFAIQDSAFANLSVPAWVMKQLLEYHTSPSKLSLQDLLNKSQGSCLETLLENKDTMITKIDAEMPAVEINNVAISHPDMFLDGSVSIHGVLEPFSSLETHLTEQGRDVIQAPTCDSNHTSFSPAPWDRIEWQRIIQRLSSNGFISFAIGLHSVLDGILQDYANLSSVTIFAPPNFGFIVSPSPLLDRTVKLHILPQKFSYMELVSLPENATLKTLVPSQDLKTSTHKLSGVLVMEGVELNAPDIISSETFIIHGISQAFGAQDLSTILR